MAGEVLMHSEKLEDIQAGQTIQTNVRETFINMFASATPANTIIAVNETSQTLILDFNDSAFEIPLKAGQTFVWDKDTLLRFSQLKVRNEELTQATGKLYLTYGWLYNKFVPADQRE